MTNLIPYFVFVYKPKGMSSTDVVRYFKHNLPKPVDKIGHIGTLDPFAEGLLMIGVNGAQKANDLIHEHAPKVYLAEGKFGSKTTSGDHTGEIVATNDFLASTPDFSTLSKDDLADQLKRLFLGEYFQKPHKVSAVKINGKRLYQYQREGIDVEVKAVKRFIFDIEVVEFNFPNILFRVKVSSGTYVRVLFEDIANSFGCFGHLTGLVREAIGDFTLKNAIYKDSWPIKNTSEINFLSYRLPEVLKFPRAQFDEHHARLYKNGVRLRVEQVFTNDQPPCPIEGQRFWAYSTDEALLGLFEIKENEIVHLFNFRNS